MSDRNDSNKSIAPDSASITSGVKKLQLNRETVRRLTVLSVEELEHVAGGVQEISKDGQIIC